MGAIKATTTSASTNSARISKVSRRESSTASLEARAKVDAFKDLPAGGMKSIVRVPSQGAQ